MLEGLWDSVILSNVADFAVAVLMWAAFGQVVNSLVADVLMPLAGALGRAPGFSASKLRSVSFRKFRNMVVNFLIMFGGIHLIVMALIQKMQGTLAKKAAEEATATQSQRSEEVTLFRDILEGERTE